MTKKETVKTQRNMVKVERPRMVMFENIGEVAEGTLMGITTGETQYGAAKFLQIQSDTGEKMSVCISASLNLIDWEELEGLYIRIEYLGDEKSKKNKGKTFKTFDVQHEEIPD